MASSSLNNATTTTSTTASTTTQSRLPLLPSDRRKKLQISTRGEKSNNDDRNRSEEEEEDDDDQKMQKIQKEEEESKIGLKQNDTYGHQSSIDLLLGDVGATRIHAYPMLPLRASEPITVEASIEQYHNGDDNNNDDDDEKIDTTSATTTSNKIISNEEGEKSNKSMIKRNSSRNKIKDHNHSKNHKYLQEEQMQTFSSMTPLTASTTTNAVTHFIHTTIKFMNSIAAEVDSKLEHCENCIEDMEIKLNLVEKKLDSTRLM